MSVKLQFGIYELDRDQMELRKHGIRIKLQDQPLLVLASLLERPGQVVTREELKERIWAKDTFVDFDQSLNKAVNRLRAALNDDAGQPRYIETVPRRGYRFVAPMTGLGPDDARMPVVPSVGVEEPHEPETKKAGSQIVRLRAMVAVASAGVLVALGLVASFWLRKPDTAAPRTPVRITRDGMAEDPKISRDGKLLVYASRGGEGKLHIWVRQTAGGEPMQVTRGVDDETAPDISPDGTQIAFRSERDGGGIYTVSTLGGGEPQLLAKGGFDPVFSPNGKEVLFILGLPEPAAYIVSPHGGAPRQLCPSWAIGGGVWSPDGNAILFFGRRRGDQASDNWMLVPAIGGDPAKFHLPGDNYKDSRFPSVNTWVKSRDSREWMVFASGTGDTYNLFRVAVFDGKLAGKEEQLTSGAGISGHGSLSADGKFVFTSGALGGQIWVVKANTDRVQTHGLPEQVTHTDGIVNDSPSISRDGRWLAYAAWKLVSGDSSIRLRDLTTGTERQLIEGTRLSDTSISPDGSRVAYMGVLNDKSAMFQVPAAGGVPMKLCQDCWPRGFSSDGSILLTQQRYSGTGRAHAVAIRIPSGEEKDFLADSKYDLWHPFFSWDDRWVSFKIVQDEPWAKLMIARVRNGAAVGESEWISVTDGKSADDKPQFSPDGNTLYFTSTRDGHLCIWAQHLDRTTKHPSGAPVVVQHFHNAQWRIMDNQRSEELWVARDKIVTNIPEFHGDIWMMKLD
jgi:Tol biopolymer transport system component/DNA-binding winged helix-turn-helix (wHTH) protein